MPRVCQGAGARYINKMRVTSQLLCRVLTECFEHRASLNPRSVIAAPKGHEGMERCCLEFHGTRKGWMTLALEPAIAKALATRLPAQAPAKGTARRDWACREMLRIICVDFLAAISRDGHVFDIAACQRPPIQPAGTTCRTLDARITFDIGQACVTCVLVTKKRAPAK